MKALLPSTCRVCAGLSLFIMLVVSGPAAAQPAVPTSPETAYADAYRIYSDGLYRLSALRFAEFRTTYPNDVKRPEALYFEASSLLEIGRDVAAVRLLEAFDREYGSHPLAYEAKLALGQHYFDAGEADEAIETLEALLAAGPPAAIAARTLYQLGETARNQGDEEQAIRYFQRCADEYPYSAVAPPALSAVATLEMGRNNLTGAADALQSLSTRHPTSPFAASVGLALAEVYYEMGDYRRAISDIESRADQLGPEARDRATFLLAESYNQLRLSEDAIIHYRRFTEQNPSSPYYRHARYGLGWNYYFEGAHQWAANEFAAVREAQTDELAGKATYYEAVNRKLASEPALAARLFAAVADDWPELDLAPNARFEEAVTLYELRRWGDATAALEKLVDDFPESALAGEAYGLLGNTYVAQGQFPKALRAYNEGIDRAKVEPGIRDEIVFQLAWLQYRQGSYREAAKSFGDIFQAGRRSEDALFWAAESYYQLGDLATATRLFNDYIRDYPTGEHVDAAHYALGWAYFKRSQYQDAIAAYRQFMRGYSEEDPFVPYRDDAQLRLADSYYALKRYGEAIAAYSVLSDRGNDYALYQIGQAHADNGNSAAAIATFSSLLLKFPESTWREEARYSIGDQYFQTGNYDEALNAWHELLDEAPRDGLAAKAQYAIGDALFNAGDLENALIAYRGVLERYASSPFVSDAASGIHYALMIRGEESGATAFIDSFAVANPASPVLDDLRFSEAEVLYQSGDITAAIAAFQRFVRTATKESLLPEAYYYLGKLHADRGETSEAASYLTQISDDHPESARRKDALLELGRIQLTRNENQSALDSFRELESLAVDDPAVSARSRYGQSMALIRLGRSDEAERLLRETVATAPDAPETVPALLGLARVFEQTGRAQEAAQLYRRIADRSQDEDGAEALYRLGGLLLSAGRPDEAIEELTKMPVLFAGHPSMVVNSYLLQARAFVQMGRTGEASRMYELIISQFPDNEQAAVARRELEAL